MANQVETLSADQKLPRAAGALRSIWRSLTQRLIARITALLALIALSTLAMQAISQQSARQVQYHTEQFKKAMAQEDTADALTLATGQFRIAAATIADRNVRGEQLAAVRKELTDSAIAITKALDSLSAAKVPALDDRKNDPILADFDYFVAAIGTLPDRVGSDDGTDYHALAASDAAHLGDLIRQIGDDLTQQRRESLAALTAVTEKWYLTIGIAGAINLLLAALLLADVIFHIIPPLRRMHLAIRRLASGDLDVEMQESRLQEISQLTDALETFRRHARALTKLAYVDQSTGMPNRRAFIEHLDRELLSPGDSGETIAVMHIDVDRFKYVNDDYGMSTADRLIEAIGKRLEVMLPEGSCVARTDGDGFSLCARLACPGTAELLSGKIVTAMRAPFDLGDCKIGATVSLGLATGSSGAQPASSANLQQQADLALSSAKRAGRNGYITYVPELGKEREVERALERELSAALTDGQVRMVYQPIHAVHDEDDREVEALVRWHHPERGEISPERFIPAAERSGQMLHLGQWIVDRALSDLRAWPWLSMSLNLSPIQLQSEAFISHLTSCCQQYGIVPARVMLEVTESIALEKDSRAFLTLQLLRRLGFRIAVDDFGTGYSSLSLLKSFHFDRLKLDRSLICDLATDETSHAVFDAAVAMGLRLGAEVVAEGVSDENLIAPLMASGCTHLQGYFFSKPIEVDLVGSYYLGVIEPQAKLAGSAR